MIKRSPKGTEVAWWSEGNNQLGLASFSLTEYDADKKKSLHVCWTLHPSALGPSDVEQSMGNC